MTQRTDPRTDAPHETLHLLIPLRLTYIPMLEKIIADVRRRDPKADDQAVIEQVFCEAVIARAQQISEAVPGHAITR